MVVILFIIFAVSLHTLVDATQLTYSKINGRLYVETDPKHFAMFGQVKDKDGVRIISVDEDGQYHLTSKCERGWTDINKIDRVTLQAYSKIREICLEEKRGPKESPQSHTWTDTFSSDQKGYSVVRLDEHTLVFASQYFPSKLARVIISGQVISFVHYDGSVRMKTIDCLYLNEKILIHGILKIEPDAKKTLFSSTGDKVLKKYLKHNSFDETYFNSEQEYSKTYTNEELAAMQRAVRGGGMRAFDGWGA